MARPRSGRRGARSCSRTRVRTPSEPRVSSTGTPATSSARKSPGSRSSAGEREHERRALPDALELELEARRIGVVRSRHAQHVGRLVDRVRLHVCNVAAGHAHELVPAHRRMVHTIASRTGTGDPESDARYCSAIGERCDDARGDRGLGKPRTAQAFRARGVRWPRRCAVRGSRRRQTASSVWSGEHAPTRPRRKTSTRAPVPGGAARDRTGDTRIFRGSGVVRF